MFSSVAFRASATTGGSNNVGYKGYGHGYGYFEQDSYSSVTLPSHGSSSLLVGTSGTDDKYLKRSNQEKARQERINAIISYGIVGFVLGILILCVIHRDTPEKVAMLEAQYHAKHYHNKPKKTLMVNKKKSKDHMHHSLSHNIKVPHPASVMVDNARSSSMASPGDESRFQGGASSFNGADGSASFESTDSNGGGDSLYSGSGNGSYSGSADTSTDTIGSFDNDDMPYDTPVHMPRAHRQAYLSHNYHETWQEDTNKAKSQLMNGAARHYKSNARSSDAVEMLGNHRTDYEEEDERKNHHHHRREKTETVREHTHHSATQRAKRKRQVMAFQLK